MFTINIAGKKHKLTQKTPILDLIDNSNKEYIVAKVNNRLRELTYELSFDANVELLDLKTSDGVKVYETSFRYLLAMAFHNLYPDYQVKISYAISRSLLITIVSPKVTMDKKMLQAVVAELDRIVQADIPFTRTAMDKADAYNYFVEQGQLDKAGALQYRPEKICHFYRCDNYLNYMYGYMAPSTGYLGKYKLFCYDGHFIAQYPRYEANGEIPEFNDEPTFSRVLKGAHKWAKICNAEIISKMNEHIVEDTYVDFINMNETLHNDMLHELGGKIADDIENIRLICIAGPSSSGKTTFSNRLRIELMSRGITPLRISLDMYYKERDQIPLDEFGEKDFEHINALDVDLFNEHMAGLIAGEEVELPNYEFENGRAEHGTKTKIGPDTPIIIEGIHALNDQLSYAIPKHQKFKIYIAPQFQINIDYHNPISYTDIRLLRRIVRDKKYRGASAERTLDMWASVRRGEFKWIYPYQEGCNYVYNSALTYELCVLKKYAMPALQEVKPESPHYVTANRLIKFLKYFKDMEDKWVPCNSLLREFIGGSCFAEVEE
ncbi:MAG: nucleoside kinase [Clostridiales bacterium]|nr:nucleoside kinase [Clostridiales bacterium]